MSSLDAKHAGSCFPALSTLEHALPTVTDQNSFNSAILADAELHTQCSGHLGLATLHDYLPIAEMCGAETCQIVFSPSPSLFSLASPTIIMSPAINTITHTVKSFWTVDTAVTSVGAMNGRDENQNPNPVSTSCDLVERSYPIDDKHAGILHPVPKLTSTRVEDLEKFPLDHSRLKNIRLPVRAASTSRNTRDRRCVAFKSHQHLDEGVEEIVKSRTTFRSSNACDTGDASADLVPIGIECHSGTVLQHDNENEDPKPNFQLDKSIQSAASTTTVTERCTYSSYVATDINVFFTQEYDDEPSEVESVVLELSHAMCISEPHQIASSISATTNLDVNAESEHALLRIEPKSISFPNTTSAPISDPISLATTASYQDLGHERDQTASSGEETAESLFPVASSNHLQNDANYQNIDVKGLQLQMKLEPRVTEGWDQLRAQTPLEPLVLSSQRSHHINTDHLSTTIMPDWFDGDELRCDSWNPAASALFELGQLPSTPVSHPSFAYVITGPTGETQQELVENRINSSSSLSSSASWTSGSTSTTDTIPVSIYQDLVTPSIPKPPKKIRKRSVKYERIKKLQSQSALSSNATTDDRLTHSTSDSGIHRTKMLETPTESHSTDDLSVKQQILLNQPRLNSSDATAVPKGVHGRVGKESCVDLPQSIPPSKSMLEVPSNAANNCHLSPEQTGAPGEEEYDPELIPSIPVSSYLAQTSSAQSPTKSSSSPNLKRSGHKNTKTRSKHAKSVSSSSTSISSLSRLDTSQHTTCHVNTTIGYKGHQEDSSLESLVPNDYGDDTPSNPSSDDVGLVPSTSRRTKPVSQRENIDSAFGKDQNKVDNPSVSRRILRAIKPNDTASIDKSVSLKTKKRAGQKKEVRTPPLTSTTGRSLNLGNLLSSPPMTNGTLSQGKVISFPKKRGRPRSVKSPEVFYEVVYTQSGIPTIVIHTPSQLRGMRPNQTNSERSSFQFYSNLKTACRRMDVCSDVPLLSMTNLEVAMQRQSSMVCGGVGRSSLRTGTGSKVLISLYATHDILEQISKSPVFFFAKSITPDMLGDLRKVLHPNRPSAAPSPSAVHPLNGVDQANGSQTSPEARNEKFSVSSSSLLAIVANLPDASPDIEFTFTDGRGYFGYNGIPLLEKVESSSRFFHNSPRPTWKLTYTARIYSTNSTVANFKGKKRDLKLAISVLQYPLPPSECLPRMPTVSLDAPTQYHKSKVTIKQEFDDTLTPPVEDPISHDKPSNSIEHINTTAMQTSAAQSKVELSSHVGRNLDLPKLSNTVDSSHSILAEVTHLHAGSIVEGFTLFGLHTQKGSHRKHPSRYAASLGVSEVLTSAASIYRRKKTFSVSPSAKRAEKITKRVLANYASSALQSSCNAATLGTVAQIASQEHEKMSDKQESEDHLSGPLHLPLGTIRCQRSDGATDHNWKRQLEMKRVTRSNAPLFDPSPLLSRKAISSESFWKSNYAVTETEIPSTQLFIRIPSDAVKGSQTGDTQVSPTEFDPRSSDWLLEDFSLDEVLAQEHPPHL